MRLFPAAAFILFQGALLAQTTAPQTPITAANWGRVTTPVYGAYRSGAYAGAELVPGPNQFGYYYAGVLPNGRKVVPPALATIQVGMNPVASAITADTHYLIVANSTERQSTYASYQSTILTGGYSLTVVDNTTLSVVSELSIPGGVYTGLIATGFGPYTIYASGGPGNDVKIFTLSNTGTLSPAVPASIPVPPLTTGGSGTFPAGMQASPDGRFLYVACNTDNSIAVIDVYQNAVVQQVPAGSFPYGVALSYDGQRLYTTNWGATSPNPSSVSIFRAPAANGYNLTSTGVISNAPPLDDLKQVGGTHPSAIVTFRNPATGFEMLYYTKSNTDSLGVVRLDQYAVLPDFDLSPISLTLADGHPVHGAYPSALVVSPDLSRLYVAESGINSVAVLDISRPLAPVLLGRIPTGWYPTALSLTSDGNYLFITNARGIGEDLNLAGTAIASDSATDSNSIFGMVQVIPVGRLTLDNTTVLANNFAMNTPADTTVVPAGGTASRLINHVFVIVQENKTFDSVLGALPSRFGAYASLNFQTISGVSYLNPQFTAATPVLQSLAQNFSSAVNFYSDAQESNAGAQYLTSGTATDYTERTVLNAGGRTVAPEDYPEGGYIFNNAARNGVSFKDYGMLTTLPVLGGKNQTGEPRLDPNYPAVSVNITDQSRALEFISDFDRMVAARTVPQLIYIYQPNDGDAALGMIVSHLMDSPIYYDPQSNTGSAIFITYASSQSAVDHIHPHRNLLVAVSPFAKPGYLATRHYSTASVVKTAELLLGLPPNNLGDLFATDLRDMFQGNYNAITSPQITATIGQ